MAEVVAPNLSPPTAPSAANAHNRWQPLSYVIAGAYAVLIALAVLHHEPWADEAQAWLLSRDTTLVGMWAKYFHYEGSPGVWHTFLHPLIKLGLPYSAYNFVSAGLGFVAVLLLLRYAPLPPLIRLTLPFTYFLFYQYAVIARSYALLAPLLFGIAALYPRVRQHIVIVTALTGVLAGVSSQAFLISAAIWAAIYLPVVLEWRTIQRHEKLRLIWTAVAYWVMLAFFALCTWPAKDTYFAEHRSFSNLRLLPHMLKVGLGGAFAGNWILSLLLIALTIPFLWRGGGLLFFALAAGSFCIFTAVVYVQVWHYGILFLAWLFAIWISAYKTPVTKTVMAALICVIACQWFWTGKAIAYDWNHAYSGSAAAAQYLRRTFGPTGAPAGGLYAVEYPTTAIEPYFTSDIYSVMPGDTRHAFWEWSTRNPAPHPDALLKSTRREMVIVGYKAAVEKKQWGDLLALLGYQRVQHFEGHTFWQTGPFEDESYDLYRQTAPPNLVSTLAMSDAAHAPQLLEGFYGIEGQTRWTAKEFAVGLKAPPGSDRDGAELTLKLFVPDGQIQELGPLTLSAKAGDFALPSRTFSQPGLYIYTAHIPPKAMASGFAVVRFQLDKSSYGSNGDVRELGLVVIDVGLAPTSQAR